MVKGWRNDPRWVELYERRSRERLQREIDRIKIEFHMRQSAEDLEMKMRSLRRPQPKLA